MSGTQFASTRPEVQAGKQDRPAHPERLARLGTAAKSSVLVCAAAMGIAAAFLFAPPVASATALPSTIKENMTLTAGGSPYTGSSVTIESGVAVKAEPGTKLTIGGLTVNGTLKAEGTTKAPVVFTSGAEEPKPGNWEKIKFESGSGSSVLDHTEVAYGGWATNTGAIEIEDSSPTITNSTIRDSGSYGIMVYGASAPNIHDNQILNSVYSAIYYGSESEKTLGINFHDNLVEGNGSTAAIYVEASSGPVTATSLGDNTVTKNSSLEAIYYSGGPGGSEVPTDIATNIVSGNTEGSADHIAFSGVLKKSVTWEDLGSPLSVENGEFTVAEGVTLTLEPGVTLQGNSIEVVGTLKAEGTAENPVVFNAGESGYRGNINFVSSSGASVLDHVEIAHTTGINTGAIEIEDSSPTITNSTIRDSGSYGIMVYGASAPNIHDNQILNSVYSAIYYGSESEKTLGINFHDNLVEGNGSTAAIYVEASSGPVTATSLGDNTVTKNSSLEAIYYSGGPGGSEVPTDIATNIVSGNTEGSADHIAFSGVLKKSVTWEDLGSPLSVENGEFTVAEGVTLTLEPGVTIEGGDFNVEGTLKAEGSEAEPVLFTSSGSTRGSIHMRSSSGASVLDHVEVVHGPGSNNGAIEIENASPTISHSTIRNSNGYGIEVIGGAPNIGYNEILSSVSSAIYYGEEGHTNEVNFHDNLVEHNGGSAAIFVEGSSGVTGKSLAGNTVKENESTQAIYYNGYEKGSVPPDIANNTVTGNYSNDISISGVLTESGTWEDHGVPVTVSNGVFTVAEGATLTLKPGMTIEGGDFNVEGTLKAEGESTNTVLFTSGGAGQRGSIILKPGSGASELDYVEVAKGPENNGAIEILNSSPTITHSTIRNSAGYGIKVESGAPEIEWNRFRGNSYGLLYEGTGELSALNNDWGCASGPKPTGCGDEVSSNVIWKPVAVLPELPRHCAGGAVPPSDPECLLSKYEPTLKYDSQENYYADSAAEITDNWGDEAGLWGESETGAYGNTLWDGDGESVPGAGDILGQSNPGFEAKFPLTIAALGTTYPNAQSADENDWLDERGEDYAEDAHALEAVGYINNAYGRVFTDGNGKLWLQYWFFYYYNSLEVLGIGEHEGDWEMVEIGLDSKDKPEVAVLSQHTGGARCEINELEQTEDGAPIVYVALDSHANYPRAAAYTLPPIFEGPLEPSPGDDYANGEGASDTPPLEIVDGELPGWLAWPGHWGNSRGGGRTRPAPSVLLSISHGKRRIPMPKKHMNVSRILTPSKKNSVVAKSVHQPGSTRLRRPPRHQSRPSAPRRSAAVIPRSLTKCPGGMKVRGRA